MKRTFLLLAAFFVFSTSRAQTPTFVTDSLDSYIKEGMKDWTIPGLAISIVKDGKVVFMKGYGVRDVKTGEPVDENTLFMIASNSKLFTGTAIAKLDYDKKLSLNDKVIKYLPWFQLYEKNSTELTTIRDVLTHRLGTKTFQGDFTIWNSKLNEEQVIRNMRLLKPTGIFRQDYGYSNSGYVTAGEIIKLVSGKPWASYLQENILNPLGMTSTYTHIAGIEKRANVAKPYTTAYSGKLKELPYDHIDNLAAAASLVSNAKDVSKWLIMQLDSGRYDGRQVLPWPVIQETRDVNITLSSRKSAAYPTHYTGYGLGVFSSDYAGRQLFRHTGGVFGFVTNTAFIPEEKLGITILTNNDNQGFFELLRLQIQDAYLQRPYKNRSKEALPSFIQEMESVTKELSGYEKLIGKSVPELPVKAYEGKYANNTYGTIDIKALQKNKLLVTFNTHQGLTATMDYIGDNEWLFKYNHIGYGIFKISFKSKDSAVESVDIKVNEFLESDPYTFVKNNQL